MCVGRRCTAAHATTLCTGRLERGEPTATAPAHSPGGPSCSPSSSSSCPSSKTSTPSGERYLLCPACSVHDTACPSAVQHQLLLDAFHAGTICEARLTACLKDTATPPLCLEMVSLVGVWLQQKVTYFRRKHVMPGQVGVAVRSSHVCDVFNAGVCYVGGSWYGGGQLRAEEREQRQPLAGRIQRAGDHHVRLWRPCHPAGGPGGSSSATFAPSR